MSANQNRITPAIYNVHTHFMKIDEDGLQITDFKDGRIPLPKGATEADLDHLVSEGYYRHDTHRKQISKHIAT